MSENNTAILLSEVVQEHHQDLLRRSKYFFKVQEDAEDHLSNVYLEILSKGPFVNGSVLYAYTLGLIKNRARDKYRQTKNHPVVETLDDEENTLKIENLPEAVSDSYTEEELQCIFERAAVLAKLSTTEWELYNLLSSGETDESICKILQKDSKYVAKLKYKVMSKIKGIGIGQIMKP